MSASAARIKAVMAGHVDVTASRQCESLAKMLSSDFYRSSATQGLMRAGRVGGASVQVPSFTSRTVASFAAGRMAAPSFAAASVREAGFTAFAAKEGGKDDWVQAFLKDLAAVRTPASQRPLRVPRSRRCAARRPADAVIHTLGPPAP